MSLNSLIEQRQLADVEALYVVLLKYIDRWKVAQTVEQRLLIEAEAVAVLEDLLDGTMSIAPVEEGEHPTKESFDEVYRYRDFLVRNAFAKLAKVTSQYLKFFNTQRVSMLELSGQLRRIKQKMATLGLWDAETAKYVVSESFLNYDSLNLNHVSLPEAFLDTVQGVLTLPVRRSTKLPVSKIRIGSGSNGQPGNSDAAVTTNNTKPEFTLNDDVTDWFEYERLDQGPLNLTLILEFSQEQIVNLLQVEPVNLGFGLNYLIEDITFSNSNSQTQSIFDLVTQDLEKDAFTIKPAGNDFFWRIAFLPVKAKTIAIKLKQSQPYGVGVLTGDGRSIQRDRFVIAIKNIGLYRNEYDLQGGIGSTELVLPGQLYAALPVLKTFPDQPSLHQIVLDCSLDGGETWRLNTANSTTLMNGDETSFLWRLKLLRNDDAFKDVVSFNGDLPRFKTGTVLKSVSRFQSPAQILLPEKPQNGIVYCIQPKVLRRGDRLGGIRIGEGTGAAHSFTLPFSTLDSGLDPDELQLLVNNRLWNRVETEAELADGVWCFSEDYKSVLLSEDLPDKAVVKVILDQELLSLEERADGFYHRMLLPFDPDPESISIQTVPRSPQRRMILVPRGQKVIRLGAKNIHNGSFALNSKLAATYTEVPDRASTLDAADNDYYVDYENGILYLASPVTTDVIKVSFDHSTTSLVSNEAIEVIYDLAKPHSIRIDKSALQAALVADTVGSAVQSRIDILTGLFGVRADSFGSGNLKVKTLTYENIIRGSLTVESGLLGDTSNPPQEVPYQDGYTEFLGLIQMLTESTTETDSTAGKVTFKLASGAAWYEPLGILFSDSAVFTTRETSYGAVNSLGDYYVDPNSGEVTVYVGSGNSLKGDIAIQYLYRDPTFNASNKYSVNYQDGIFYSFTDMVVGSKITYKVAVGKISYDVASEIDQYSYDPVSNTVLTRTEALHELNGLIKVCWARPSEEPTLESLKQYYTPFISMLGYRFN